MLLRETDLDDTVRPPINAAEASKLLEHIEKWKGKVSKQWKARANAHQQAIEKGDPLAAREAVYNHLDMAMVSLKKYLKSIDQL